MVGLTPPDDDLVHLEVDVLDSQATAFEQAQAGAIEKGGHEPGRAVQLGDHRAHLVAGEDDGEALLDTEADSLRLVLAEGETLALMDSDLLAEAEGLRLGDSDKDGLTLALGLNDLLADALGDADAD